MTGKVNLETGRADKAPVSRFRRHRSARETGVVMVVTAIVFPILIMSVAFVVDVSMFFFKSIQVQRTADAAALAGVTRMPRVVDARKLAIDIAKRNGYQNNVNNVTVVVAPPPDTNKRLKVTIVDNSTPLFFGTTFLKNWTIQKTSTAEYVSNIPLGSKENAIGTGDVVMNGTPGQGFWLAISGPCAPKEAGDQVAARYDGTAIRRGRFPADPSKNMAMICDYNKSESDPTTAPFPSESIALNKPIESPPELQSSYVQRLRDHIGKARDNKNAASPGLFPGLSINRDWDPEGYNYIVDVPCYNSADPTSPPPPPCDGSDQGFNGHASTANRDLVIQAFDPVFNPVSIKGWRANPFFTDATSPDVYGLPGDYPAPADPCDAATPAGCIIPTGAGNPRPDTVRVTTRFSVYGPDLTPLDYSDDEPVKIRYKDYGSCVRKWDTPTVVYADPVDTQDVNPAPECATAAGQWVEIARIPASDVHAMRGRFRVNVRTLTAVDSFGSNSFSLRSFFDVSGGSTWKPCSDASVSPLACASVSGDSTMGVFATAPSIKEFYLAKLAPAAIYRGKTVMVRLWDAGEGGSSIQVLRPRVQASSAPVIAAETCNYTLTASPLTTWTNPDPAASTDYCTQKIKWSVGQTGINNYTDTTKSLKDNGPALGDVCDAKGKDDQFSLSIAGSQNDVETCTLPVPSETFDSRNGPYDTDRGKFNDRLVNIKVEVPSNYGCEPQTWATLGTCTEIALPQQGWWKIKYIPVADSSEPTGYIKITDRSTWTVELLGEPVHLVLDN
jgi:Flp pilus assembly protein TadG